jgi:radical SAM protein with 4Fe4S-binding SPASM domain
MTTVDARRIPDHIKPEELDDEQRHYLLKSNTFCIIPWLHLHAHPDGRAFPCCLADMSAPLGNLREQTIDELWNSAGYRELRRNMLEGKKSAACHKCYEQERAGFFSKRNSSNKQLGHHIAEIRNTGEDGSVPKPHLVYWDIRFSNLCNLSCRSCGALFSSSWYEDHAALYGQSPSHPRIMSAGRGTEDLWLQLYEHLPALEKITFGGGEPLIMEEHYRILKELDARKMYHVKLFYHTNFTNLRYKDQDVLDLWNKFDEVNVGASLDAMGSRAELLRKGSQWEKVEANRRNLMQRCPKVNFYVAPTLGLTNSLHLPDFHRAWVEDGFIEAGQWELSVLQEPAWLRLDVLPPPMKIQVTEKYNRHIEWLERQGAPAKTLADYRNAVIFMNREDRTAQLGAFAMWTKKLDAIRGEMTVRIFPELTDILQMETV